MKKYGGWIWKVKFSSTNNYSFLFIFCSSKVATALDPRFKDLKCLPRAEREPVWAKLRELVKGEEPALQPLGEENPEPPKKKTALLVMDSDSESEEETPEDNTVERYKVEPSAILDQCPLKWWSEHTAVYGKIAHIARKYLGTPATTVPCERLFSLAGHIVQKRRSSLSPETVNKLVCLSDWWKKKK